ncbi:MAG: DUF362 domain-containing protein [Nitrososphaeria archaeon]
MLSAKVALVKGEDPHEMVRRALELIRAEDLVSTEDTVLIKPNYITAKDPSTGVTTDPLVVEELIRFAKRCGAKSITVGDGGAGDTERAFDTVGLRDIVSRLGVNLVDLNRDRRARVRIPGALSLNEVDIARTVIDSTCMFNVPSLKVHHMALVTLCMKNLMGVVLPKGSMHAELHAKLVDLASLLKPRINVIEGIVGSELDEVDGNPVRMDVIIAGTDIVATDAVGAMVMGIDPKKVTHIQLASKRGLGVGKIQNIEILGDPVESVRRDFKLPPTFQSKF